MNSRCWAKVTTQWDPAYDDKELLRIWRGPLPSTDKKSYLFFWDMYVGKSVYLTQ